MIGIGEKSLCQNVTSFEDASGIFLWERHKMASKIAACAAVLCAAVGSDAFMPTPSHLGGVQQRLPVSAGAARTTRPKTGLLAASLSTQNLEKASTRTQARNVDVSKLSDILKLNVSQERLYGKKTVVITGSSSGIGLQAAIELAKEVRGTREIHIAHRQCTSSGAGTRPRMYRRHNHARVVCWHLTLPGLVPVSARHFFSAAGM